MIIANLLMIVGIVLLAIAGGAAAYHLALTLFGVYLYATRKPTGCFDERTATNRFVILIPAHNERECIAETLQTCRALQYPQDRVRIVVVADNCSDDTAAIVRGLGVTCWERTNEAERGKGQALEWAFARLQLEEWDAVVVLDADCRIDSHALHRFDEELLAGQPVLQAKYVTSNPDSHAQAYLLSLANAHENELFYAPKSALGLAVVLRGTGMVFRRDVLQQVPWNADSIVEDAQYGYQLLARGVPVCFLSDTCVHSPFPTNREQLVVQRTRWIRGSAQIARTHTWRLLGQGVLRGKARMIDAALNAWLISKPMLLMQVLAALIASVTLHLWLHDELSRKLLVGSAVVIATYVVIALTSVYMLGVTARRARFWLLLPGHSASYLLLSASALMRTKPLKWERTPRPTRPADEPSAVECPS